MKYTTTYFRIMTTEQLTFVCLQAIDTFGPLNAVQLKEKLAMRNIHRTEEEIAEAMENYIDQLPAYSQAFRYAIGFDVRTYK